MKKEIERIHTSNPYLSSTVIALALAAITLIAAAFGLLTPYTAQADAIFASGSGTQASPYVIQTSTQLGAFRDSVDQGTSYKGQYIQLASDVDISGADWYPIGYGTRSGTGTTGTSHPFSGNFDGAGHTVSGLTITKQYNADFALGLFGILDGATVQNLTLTNININSPGTELAGGVAGMAINGSTITNVQTSGNITGAAGLGGVLGRLILNGTISNCKNSANVTASGTGNTGGIVGAAYYTAQSKQMIISTCSNSGKITGTQATGGIAGLNASFISDCSNTGAIISSNYSAGGIAGEQRNYGAVNGCTNSGSVTVQATDGYGTGGIIGWIRYNGPAASYAAMAPVSVTNNTNSASISGGNDAGGIVGTLYDAGTVIGNTNTAPKLQSNNFAGGIVGNLQKSVDGPASSSVPVKATIENNVSTTPMASITAPLKGQYAYNNSPDVFAVDNNGTAWVAENDHAKFATLPFAVSMTGNNATVKLITDVADCGSVAEKSGDATTIDLNGHNVSFASSPAFNVPSGKITIVGSGRVLTQNDDLASLVGADTSKTPVGDLVLEGGAYKQDVTPYIGNGYAQYVLPQPIDGAKYLVAPYTQTNPGITNNTNTTNNTGNTNKNTTVANTNNAPKNPSPAAGTQGSQPLAQTDDGSGIPLALATAAALLSGLAASLFTLGARKLS